MGIKIKNNIKSNPCIPNCPFEHSLGVAVVPPV